MSEKPCSRCAESIFSPRLMWSLTVSDHIKRGERMTSEQREQGFSDMVEIGLDTVTAGV